MEHGSLGIVERQAERRAQDSSPNCPGWAGEPRAEQIGMAQRVGNRDTRDPRRRCEFSVVEHAPGKSLQQCLSPKYRRAPQNMVTL
jgi:hypothetical protein